MNNAITHFDDVQQLVETKSKTFITDAEIAKIYGVSRQTVWRWARLDPKFPKTIKLSAGVSRWKLSELEAWEQSKVIGG